MPRPDSLAIAALLTALVSFGPLSIDTYLPALPGLALAFGVDTGAVQLTLSAFVAGFAISQLIVGPLSDRVGRRPVMLAGLALFALASIGCAFAQSIEALIAARVVQSVGACSGAVLARAVVRDVYGRERGATVLAYMSSAMSLAPLIAPMLGGYLYAWFGWQAIFVLLAAIGATLFALVLLMLAETNAHRAPDAVDPGMLVGNYITILKDRSFVGYAASNALGFAGVFAFISGSSFVLVGSLGVAPQHFGFYFGLSALGFMAGTLTAGRFSRRVGLDRMMLIGTSIVGAAGLAIALPPLFGIETIATVVAPMAVYAMGMGISMPNGTAGAIGPFPRMAGAASAMLGFLQMGLASLSGFAVGQAFDGTARPMTLTMAAMGLSAMLAFRLLVWRRRAAA